MSADSPSSATDRASSRLVRRLALGLVVAAVAAVAVDGTTTVASRFANPSVPNQAGAARGTAFLPLQLKRAAPMRDAVLMSHADQIGGASHAVDVIGDVAFVGVGPRLVAVDVSDVDAPRRLGQSAPMASLVFDVSVQGDRAYVLSQWHGDPNLSGSPAGIFVVDVSEPAAPTVLGRHDLAAASLSIDAAGHRVFVAVVAPARSGLIEIDASNPAQPVESGFLAVDAVPLEDGIGSIGNITVRDDIVFVTVADSASGEVLLLIVDVSVHGDPTERGRLSGLGDTVVLPTSLALDGDHVYLGGSDGIAFIDVTAPDSPKHLGSLAWWQTGYVSDLVSLAGHIYVVNVWNELTVFEALSTAAPPEPVPSPPHLASLDLSDDVYISPSLANNGIAAAGGRVLVPRGVGRGGLQIVDTADPDDMHVRGLWRTLDDADCARLRDDRLFVTNSKETRVYDVSAPLGPVELARTEVGGGTLDAAVDGDRLLLLGVPPDPKPTTLQIVDIRDLSAAELLGSYLPSGSPTHVAMSGAHAFLSGQFGLEVVDVQDPTEARRVAFHEVPTGAGGIAVVDSYAYLAAHRDGLQILDMSNPAAPRTVGHATVRGSAEEVLVADGLAYLTVRTWHTPGTRGELVTFDVSDPARPLERAVLPLPYNTIGGLARMGDLLFTVSLVRGIHAFDLTKPDLPREAGHYYLPVGVDTTSSCRLGAGAGTLYRAAGDSGLHVLRTERR